MIISDILMPVRDGFKLCREIRSDSRTCNIPFVFYTGTYTRAEDEEFAFKMGADRFLVKSTEWSDLFRVLQDVIREKEMGETVLPEDSSPENSFPKNSSIDEEEIYKVYNARLIKKLEDKVAELEQEVAWRKKLEKQLYDSQQSLQLALDGANLGMWDWNIQTGDVKFNEKWLKLFGYKTEEVTPDISFWGTLMHPDDRQRSRDLLDANLHGDSDIYENEYRVKNKSGHWQWVLARGKVASRDAAGKPLRHVGTLIEVSDRKNAVIALETSHVQMEKQIEIRTADLLKSNQQLESEILQRSKIEAALRESEERFRMMAENSQDMIYRMSLPDGVYEYVSPSASVITGYTPHELYQNPLLIKQIIHPDWHDYFDEKWAGMIKGAFSAVYEFQIIRKTGEVRWIYQKNTLIRDVNREPVAVEGICTDITELKQAEMSLAKQNEHLDELVAERTSKLQVVSEALNDEKERYRLIFNSAPIGIYHYDINSVITECNPATYSIFGSSYESAVGLNQLESLKNNDIINAVKKSLSGRPGRFQGPYTSVLSGKTAMIKALFVPLFSDSNILIGGIGVIEDISSQIKASEQLAKSEKKYRTILESIEDGYFEVDLAGNLIFFNNALAGILGYPASELKGKNYRSFMDEEYARKTYQSFNQSYKTGMSSKEFDWKIIQKNGAGRYLDTLVSPIKDADEKVTGFRGVARDVSERRLMQKFLAESEERFRLTVESAPVGIFSYDKNGIIQACNQAYVDINGSSYGKLIGFNLLKSVTNTLALTAVQKSLAGSKGHYEGEYTSVTGGRRSYIKADFVPVFSEDKSLAGGMCVVEDITERKRAEEKLQKSEEKYRNLFQHSNDAIFVHTLDGKIIDANSAACLLVGYDKETFLTLTVQALHTEESAPDAVKAINMLKENGWVRFDSKFVRADGAIIDVDIGARIVEPENGIVQGIVRDITDRVIARQALRDSEEKYRGLAERSPIIIILIKNGGRPYYVSPSVTDVLGFLPEDILGRLPGVFMSKEDEARVFSLMRQIQDGVDVDSFEVPMLKKDGTPATIEWTLIPIKKGDELDGFQAIGRDITEKKIAEDLLRKSRKQLRELSKHLQTSREQERAGIAREIHDDLGQSLTAIKMDAVWLKSKIPEDRAELHIKAEDTIFLVDSAIKTVKRISSELRPGLLDDLGLSAAIEWQAKEYQKRSNINIDVTIEPEEIVLSENLSIAIFRVCQETLTNVIRHAGATEVRVRLTKNSQLIELEVTDNGCGISDQSLFKKNSFGLIGMRERVHAIGGKISISRLQKGGTKVAVTVPLVTVVNS
jgi:PAS domain S-box-containing protein